MRPLDSPDRFGDWITGSLLRILAFSFLLALLLLGTGIGLYWLFEHVNGCPAR